LQSNGSLKLDGAANQMPVVRQDVERELRARAAERAILVEFRELPHQASRATTRGATPAQVARAPRAESCEPTASQQIASVTASDSTNGSGVSAIGAKNASRIAARGDVAKRPHQQVRDEHRLRESS